MVYKGDEAYLSFLNTEDKKKLPTHWSTYGSLKQPSKPEEVSGLIDSDSQSVFSLGFGERASKQDERLTQRTAMSK
jgi:hypothetical protein